MLETALQEGIHESQQLPNFSLLGGPLHRLGLRLGLVRRQTNTIPLGLVLGLFLWVVVVALGIGHQIFSLALIGGHVRLIAGIPLLFICETWIDPRITAWVRTLVRSGVVPKTSLPALELEIARISRWRDSWLPDVLCLLLAVSTSTIAQHLHLPGLTTGSLSAQGDTPLYTSWYRIICLPLFRFLIFRWIWRLGLWWRFLWRLARLELHLVPTHPDLTAGLGGLSTVHLHFIPLVVAISMVNAASFAEEISTGVTAFDAIYPELAIILIIDAVLFLGPLSIFIPKLWACRMKGLGEYMTLAAHYVDNFDRKWLRNDAPEEPLLGTPDLQSLADLTNSVNVVRNMRSVPIGGRLVTYLAIAALAPLLPLLLLKYPLAAVAQKMLQMLVGV
ncbi:MAG TPA: hypothetical protein VLE19_00500 [Pyrinomonadaceae bacterium]|nr:hypothetical protein [Pyrinomonadaceae bacterium]